MRWALAAIAAALVLASPAQTHFGGGGLLAKRIAVERFPDHCGPYRIDHRRLRPKHLGWVPAGQCRIYLSKRLHAYSFAWRCTILVHEFGHLAGRKHSRDPDSLMYPSPPIFPPCLKS